MSVALSFPTGKAGARTACESRAMADLVISLTTIPSRLRQIEPTLRDLLAQRADVAEIRLYLPRRYRRFDFAPTDVPKMPSGVRVCFVDEDFGPATKVLPAIADCAGQDVEILFCDDDQPYDPNWAQRFLDTRRHQPDACIVEKGYELETRPPGARYYVTRAFQPRARLRRKGIGYRALRLVSLTMIKPRAYTTPGYVDVLEGYRGGLVRPDFFPPEVFDIPDILWTVDDPWLSGHLTRNGVPIWLMTDVPAWGRPYGAHYTDRLGKLVYKDHGRLEADTACFEYFRKTYGIWQDRNPGGGPDQP